MIFLDLTKAYDALDRSRSLEILKGYGLGDRVRRLLQEYWDRTMMVARAGGYYGKGVKGRRGVTQGDPLPPTIFNVVVDLVVRHWVTLAVTEQKRRGIGGGRAGIRPPSYTRTTACSRRPTPSGYSGCFRSSLECLTGWDSTRFPAAVHGLHVMLTVFTVFVLSPTLSNSPTSCVNAQCSHWGSDDVSMPSSV